MAITCADLVSHVVIVPRFVGPIPLSTTFHQQLLVQRLACITSVSDTVRHSVSHHVGDRMNTRFVRSRTACHDTPHEVCHGL